MFNENSEIMKNIKLFSLAFTLGLFLISTVGNTAVFEHDHDKHGQQQQQEQEKEGMQAQERAVEINQLPQAVQETLQEEYEDYEPTEAFLASDPEEGTFYKVKLNNTQEGETKTVMISTDGEVIDEEDGEEFDQEGEKKHHGREY
jgi:methionyl-tRNA synthetase